MNTALQDKLPIFSHSSTGDPQENNAKNIAYTIKMPEGLDFSHMHGIVVRVRSAIEELNVPLIDKEDGQLVMFPEEVEFNPLRMEVIPRSPEGFAEAVDDNLETMGLRATLDRSSRTVNISSRPSNPQREIGDFH